MWWVERQVRGSNWARVKRKSRTIPRVKGNGNGRCYYGIFWKKVPLKRIRKERSRMETIKKVSNVIAIVIQLL